MTGDDLQDAFGRAGEAAERSSARVERRSQALIAPGVPTFLEAPRVDLEEMPAGLDAVFLGVPFEGVVVRDPRTFYPQGTAPAPGHDLYSRPGAYQAPAAIRQASLFFSLDHSNGLMPELGLSLGESLGIADAGDVDVAQAPAQRALVEASAAVRRILGAGAVPLVAGGDHLVTLFVLAGIFEATGGPVGVITYDSHYDLSWEPRYWAGSQWARAMELGALRPRNLAQIGIRGLRNSVFWDAARRELGVNSYTIADVEERGLDAVTAEAIERASDGVDALYVSIDVDAFEPSACPAQKYPEPGGFSAREVLRSLRRVMADGAPLAGFDLCCLGPAYDRDHLGSSVAARCFVEVLGGLAKRKG